MIAQRKRKTRMDATRKMAFELLDMIEALTLEVLVLRGQLAAETEGADYWKEEVGNLKILRAPAVHALFAPCRAVIDASQSENLLPGDLNSIVRRILDTVQEPDDPAPSH
jgi:hypothetical protein